MIAEQLLQLRVLSFGLPRSGDVGVGVGVFSECEPTHWLSMHAHRSSDCFCWSQRDKRYADDDEHRRSDQFPASNEVVERLERHDGGVSLFSLLHKLQFATRAGESR